MKEKTVETYVEEFIGFFFDAGADGEGLPLGGIGTGDDRSDAGEKGRCRCRVDRISGYRRHQDQFEALLDPIVRQNGLPVLRADDVQQPVVQAPSHAVVQHFEEFRSGRWLRAAQTSQKSWFQFGN